jgi:tetratricopeptide (TPR) repeat protein
MGSFFGDALRPLADVAAVPVLLALCLLCVAMITRTFSFARYYVWQQGRRTLVVRIDGGVKGMPGARHQALTARLLAYLAADARGNYVIAPGAGGPSAPGVTAEALEPSSGWQAALLRMAIVRPPSYLVDVDWSGETCEQEQPYCEAIVRISRAPGDRIVASGTLRELNVDDLVQTVGCFCITFLRSQSRTLQQTPRWERWGRDIQGYRAYRRGLVYQSQAELMLGPGDHQHPSRRDFTGYKNALDSFHEAARFEPANLLVQLHRAALLELTGDYESAVSIYEKCHTLWPEHIETSYRLGSACKTLSRQAAYRDLASKHLTRIEEQLRLRKLIWAWCRTVGPWRWNPGERRYWRSWLQIWLPGRTTKRAEYMHAVAVAKLLARLSSLPSQPDGSQEPGLKPPIDELMEELARQVLRRRAAPCWMRLLHPEIFDKSAGNSRLHGADTHNLATHYHRWHGGDLNDPAYIPTYTGTQYRANIGWLALFNAACFFSHAMLLPADQLPDAFRDSPGDWWQDCARAAIRELGILVRHPQHSLDPDWLGTDADLEPLRSSSTGKAWMTFVGLRTPSVLVPQQACSPEPSPRTRP